MVQRCWNKGPLGPSIGWGCFVLAYFDEEDEVVMKMKERFGGEVVEAEKSPDPDEVRHGKALVWCWS
ncbi:MAG: hypothetical protein GXO07_03960 [Crenarchaeota archaeon]|nr:hypothetical protein [Thermoproteota archaeon]